MISLVEKEASVTPIKRRRRRATPAPTPVIAERVGVVDQVRVACSRRHRLATVFGCLIGAIVPFAIFCVAHSELKSWTDPKALLVLGGLAYSARTVYQWGRLAFESGLKALGFTVLLEGIMVTSSQQWLAITVLVYLCAINAIATGVTLARGAQS